MNLFQSLSHFASFAMNLYMVYFAVSALAFAGYLWNKVYRSQPQPVLQASRQAQAGLRRPRA